MKPRNKETILITGTTGNVGTEVVKQLSRVTPPVTIRAAVHSVKNVKRVNNDMVEDVQIDYNKPETLSAALKGVDRLFLVTPETSNAPEHASNLVTQAKEAGTRHIVKLSAQGAHVNAVVASLRLHRQAEKIIEESGIPFTFLRPGEFMQNFVNFFSQTVKEQGAFYLPAGDSKISFVDARDIAAVGVKALTNDGRHNGKAYSITGPEALSYYQVAEILSHATGKKIDYVNISEEEARHTMRGLGIGDWWINAIIEVYEFYKSCVQAQISPAVEEITGNKPISFSQFAKDYADAFR
jgi:uncharacterized protein YbjT (DUF2867 family)